MIENEPFDAVGKDHTCTTNIPIDAASLVPCGSYVNKVELYYRPRMLFTARIITNLMSSVNKYEIIKYCGEWAGSIANAIILSFN